VEYGDERSSACDEIAPESPVAGAGGGFDSRSWVRRACVLLIFMVGWSLGVITEVLRALFVFRSGGSRQRGIDASEAAVVVMR
jgi:hypothetical protein